MFFGEEFYGCGELIVLLSITIPFVAWANVVRTQFLIPTKNDKVYLLSTTVGAFLNLIFNSIFIPRFGANGAVYGSIIAEASVFLTQFIFTFRQLPYGILFKNSFPYIICSFIMLGSIKAVQSIVPSNIVGLFVLIAFGVIIFGVSVVVYSFKGKDSVSVFIRKIIRK